MRLVSKYHSKEKALEYGAASWPHFERNSLSEPFYVQVSGLVDVATQYLGLPAPICVEFAVGAGRLLFELKHAIPNARIVGFDISPAMLEITRLILLGKDEYSLFGRAYRGFGESTINVFLGDAEYTPLRTGIADIVLCVNMLDRVRHTRKAMLELARITRHNGMLIVITGFDYESNVTLPGEDIDRPDFTTFFTTHGCEIILQQDSSFTKESVLDHQTKTCNEFILVLKKTQL